MSTITRHSYTLWVDVPHTSGPDGDSPDYAAPEVERMIRRALRKLELDSEIELIGVFTTEDGTL